MPGVSKEQIQAAREADLFAYLQFHEPGVLKRDGPNYRHKEHDSLVYVTGKKVLVLEQPGPEYQRPGLSDPDSGLRAGGCGPYAGRRGNPADAGLSEYNSNRPCA